MRLTFLVALFFCALFISPFLLSLRFVTAEPVVQWSDFLWGFQNSLIQSFFAAAASVVIGLIFARALCFQTVHQKILRALEAFLLIPLFLPTLVVCLVLLILVEPFPFGNLGVILTQVFVYSGMVGVSLAQALRNRFSLSADVALILGARQFLFWREVVLPGLKRDLLLHFTLVFAACFSSFSVPLLMGGGRAENLEILIFDTIRNFGDWAGAVALMLVQLIFLGIFAFVVQKNQGSGPLSRNRISTNQLFTTRVEFYLFTAGSLSFAGLLLGFFAEVLYSIEFMNLLKSDLISLSGGTFLIVILALLMTTTLFLVFLCLSKVRFLNTFFSSFFAPSTAIAALAVASYFGSSGVRTYFVISLVFALFTFPILYKLFWESHFQNIRKAWEVARTCGASTILTVKEVLLPMMREPLRKSLGLTVMWSSADFAISRVVATQEVSLAMRIDRLLSSYYFENSFGILLLLILMNVFFYFLIKGAFSVISQKS